jgi:hypothetical protein
VKIHAEKYLGELHHPAPNVEPDDTVTTEDGRRWRVVRYVVAPDDARVHRLLEVEREVAGADQVDCGDGEAFEVVSAASGVLRVRLIGLVPSAFITQTSKSPSRLDVNAMRVPSGACCSSHVRFSGSAAWPAFRA